LIFSEGLEVAILVSPAALLAFLSARLRVYCWAA